MSIGYRNRRKGLRRGTWRGKNTVGFDIETMLSPWTGRMSTTKEWLRPPMQNIPVPRTAEGERMRQVLDDLKKQFAHMPPPRVDFDVLARGEHVHRHADAIIAIDYGKSDAELTMRLVKARDTPSEPLLFVHDGTLHDLGKPDKFDYSSIEKELLDLLADQRAKGNCSNRLLERRPAKNYIDQASLYARLLQQEPVVTDVELVQQEIDKVSNAAGVSYEELLEVAQEAVERAKASHGSVRARARLPDWIRVQVQGDLRHFIQQRQNLPRTPHPTRTETS